jgi:hypothetical protein
MTILESFRKLQAKFPTLTFTVKAGDQEGDVAGFTRIGGCNLVSNPVTEEAEKALLKILLDGIEKALERQVYRAGLMEGPTPKWILRQEAVEHHNANHTGDKARRPEDCAYCRDSPFS